MNKRTQELAEILITHFESVCDRALLEYPKSERFDLIGPGHYAMSHISSCVSSLHSSFAPSNIHGPEHPYADALCQEIQRRVRMSKIIKDDAKSTINGIRSKITELRSEVKLRGER
jgi:hypothetical protein